MKASGRAACEIGLQHPLDHAWCVVLLDVAQHLGADRRINAEAAADMDVKAFDAVFIRDRDLGADQADVADEVLRAGVMTAGEMDVDRRVERHARLAILRDRFRGLLGMRGGEAAAAGSGAEIGRAHV